MNIYTKILTSIAVSFNSGIGAFSLVYYSNMDLITSAFYGLFISIVTSAWLTASLYNQLYDLGDSKE